MPANRPYRNLHLVKAKEATHALDKLLHVVIDELAHLKQLLGQGKLYPASLQVQQNCRQSSDSPCNQAIKSSCPSVRPVTSHGQNWRMLNIEPMEVQPGDYC